MSTLLKIAFSAKEVDEVLKLRHQVYVVEDGKWGGVPLPGERIMDRYDAMPFVANIVAYEGKIPIGTIRIVKQMGAGLPADEFVDFSSYLALVGKECDAPVFACAGMLAIVSHRRKRRDVIMALFKMATGVCMHWGVTHVIANANHDAVSVYEHLGFDAVGEKIWVGSIGNHVVPMAAPLARPIDWAFRGLMSDQVDSFWLDSFSGCLERVLLSPNEVLFEQGSVSDSVYLVDEGWISIVRMGDNRELNLAKLSKGAIFGELAMIDNSLRSAKAVADTYSEVIRISKDTFKEVIASNPESVDKLLSIFAKRLRSTDELVMVMAYAPQTGRVKFALNKLRESATPHRKQSNTLVSKGGASELAKVAGVREFEVLRVLELERERGNLDYSERWIHFFELRVN